jgi:Rhodanese-like domain.
MTSLLNAKKAFAIFREGDCRFIDCRFSFDDPSWGKKVYGEGHIPGAVYLDMEKDLSGEPKNHGGRHPLPDMGTFLETIRAFGIREDLPVICYDQGGAPFAARLWWMMKYIGHDRVYILNGGIPEWLKADYPVDKKMPEFAPTTYLPNIRRDMVAEVEEVRETVEGTRKAVLIDSRESARFLGEREPIDRVAGRIPGAVNRFWLEGFHNGTFLSAEKQKIRFRGLNPEQELIVYCGSGVTACPNVLSLYEAGFRNVKLYVGSFSDWISYPEHPIEKGKSGKGGTL